MARKKKNKNVNAAAVQQALDIQATYIDKAEMKKLMKEQSRPNIVKQWNEYFGRGDLADWQGLMRDLLFEETFSSKTQCRKVLKGVWINIPDFLKALSGGGGGGNRRVYLFPNEATLAQYTVQSGKFYPKNSIPKGSPLRELLANITKPGRRGGGGGGSGGGGKSKETKKNKNKKKNKRNKTTTITKASSEQTGPDTGDEETEYDVKDAAAATAARKVVDEEKKKPEETEETEQHDTEETEEEVEKSPKVSSPPAMGSTVQMESGTISEDDEDYYQQHSEE